MQGITSNPYNIWYALKLNRMVKQEYLSVANIANQCNMTTRNVRRIINELSETKNKHLLHKDNYNRWQVHQLLKPKFKRQRNRKQPYFALSFKADKGYSSEDISKIIEYAFSQIDDHSLEINYVIEYKKANGQPHIHSYIKSMKKVEVLKILKLLFANLSFYESKIFDLPRWQQYITKEGSPIITLTKNELKNDNKL